MHRVGICGMTVIWGMLARLTWWEYSWDVMEPCTFFVTYGGAILCYSYYLGTKTNPDYDDVSQKFRKSDFSSDAIILTVAPYFSCESCAVKVADNPQLPVSLTCKLQM